MCAAVRTDLIPPHPSASPTPSPQGEGKKTRQPKLPCLRFVLRSDLVGRPVDVGELFRPLLINAVAYALSLMIVRRFLHIAVVPLCGVHVIAPVGHLADRKEIGHILSLTIEHAVYHCHGLGTGDVIVGLERAVGVAVYPAVAGRKLDVLLCPVPADVVEGLAALLEVAENIVATSARVTFAVGRDSPSGVPMM